MGVIRRSAVLGVTESLPQRVVAALNRDIESGELAPGSRLPTEQQLANRLGVSRNVVREAIAQLRADGLIEARQGVGAFVLSPEQRAAIRIDRDSLKEPGNMQRLFELRSVLETEAAALAAARRSPQQLASIKAHLDCMNGEEKWQDGSIDADLAFHREIAAASRHPQFDAPHRTISDAAVQLLETGVDMFPTQIDKPGQLVGMGADCFQNLVILASQIRGGGIRQEGVAHEQAKMTDSEALAHLDEIPGLFRR